MPITIFDGIVIGVVLFSAVLAMVRGFSREILSIASWGGSAAAAYYLYPHLVPYAKKYTDDDRIAIVGLGRRRLPDRADHHLLHHHEDRRFHHRQPHRRA